MALVDAPVHAPASALAQPSPSWHRYQRLAACATLAVVLVVGGMPSKQASAVRAIGNRTVDQLVSGQLARDILQHGGRFMHDLVMPFVTRPR